MEGCRGEICRRREIKLQKYMSNHALNQVVAPNHDHHHSSALSSDIAHILHELSHFLPSQLGLKDFIHHNTLHAYQHMKFYDAIFKASAIFGYQTTLQLTEFRQLYKNGRIKAEVLDHVIGQSKGSDQLVFWKEKLLNAEFDTQRKPRIGQLRANWKKRFGLDLDSKVNPLLFRVLTSYMDQGVATWQFPSHPDGFLASLKALEQNSIVSLFKTSKAKNLLLSQNCSLDLLLHQVVGNPIYFEQYLFDQQFGHQGWSGFVSAIEQSPAALLDQRKISLEELIIFELLLEIDALQFALGNTWQPISTVVSEPPISPLADIAPTELTEVLRLWQDAFEWSYYDQVLVGLSQKSENQSVVLNRPSFQAVFCIDERECSLRRHIESVDQGCETFGAPGFFGVEFFFQPENGLFYEKLCPAPVTPAFLIKETNGGEERPHDFMYQPQTNQIAGGFLYSLGLGVVSAWRIVQTLFFPKMSPAISNAYAHMQSKSVLTIENTDPLSKENGLQIGFGLSQMTDRVEGVLRGIGLITDFAPIVYFVAHGSSSANNPHHGAHDCGACSGRPGSVNARVFAGMANHTGVRAELQKRGITIPIDTIFVGGLHDTAADEIAFFDQPSQDHLHTLHQKNLQSFETALDLNAKERSRRFVSINTKQPISEIRKAIKARSVSLFEPRPELGHGTNTLCIVGRRAMTKSLFLDRRAFLNSYDYRTDLEGKLLPGVLRPLGLVCGGINLEYYFSRVDNLKFGAGTKLPHNVVGLFGVSNGSDGDLRPGLPLQMIEVHDPVRLLLIVEHYPEVVLKAIQNEAAVYEWYANEWVHIIAIHPETRLYYRLQNGVFEPYQPTHQEVASMTNFDQLVESWAKMPTNQIADATRENLPVFTLKRS
jgi:uncharacterized protein